MFDSFFKRTLELNRAGTPFVLATVVRHEKPSSGKAGDKAIILPDGSIEGWVGGGCAQPIVIREARLALDDRKSRFVRIAPEGRAAAKGVIEYPMSCHSGGALDVYIEPVFPKPHLVIFGSSQVAVSLSKLGAAMDYRVTVIAPEAESERFSEAENVLNEITLEGVAVSNPAFVVVATQGENDEKSLEVAAGSDLEYVAFVASRRKSAAVFETLLKRGVEQPALDRVRTPAGLDIHAQLPEEIALSILAEIVQELRSAANPDTDRESDEAGVETIRIAGMSCGHCIATVEKALRGIEGLNVRSVDLGEAKVSYENGKVSRAKIVDALADVGYEVEDDGHTVDTS